MTSYRMVRQPFMNSWDLGFFYFAVIVFKNKKNTIHLKFKEFKWIACPPLPDNLLSLPKVYISELWGVSRNCTFALLINCSCEGTTLYQVVAWCYIVRVCDRESREQTGCFLWHTYNKFLVCFNYIGETKLNYCIPRESE